MARLCVLLWLIRSIRFLADPMEPRRLPCTECPLLLQLPQSVHRVRLLTAAQCLAVDGSAISEFARTISA